MRDGFDKFAINKAKEIRSKAIDDMNQLVELLNANTNPNDVVLDCFSGSGSTMISSYNVNREFVGCELDTSYYEKSKERLNQFHPMLSLFHSK